MNFVIPFSTVLLLALVIFFLINPLKKEKLFSFLQKRVAAVVALSVPLGGVAFFTASELFVSKSGLARITKNKSIQARFGGSLSESDADKFTFEFSSHLKEIEPNSAQYNTFYTAGTWYTAEELGNFMDKLLTENPNLTEKEIRIYFCPIIYPNRTSNLYTGKDVSFRISSSLIAFKPPYNIVKVKPDILNIMNNPNCLGCYNWGGLEP